jgi:hypothetical protein
MSIHAASIIYRLDYGLVGPTVTLPVVGRTRGM